jgi:hypothetical protein
VQLLVNREELRTASPVADQELSIDEFGASHLAAIEKRIEEVR